MPEGHTIHRIANDHSKLLAARTVRVTSPQGRFAADAAMVDGRVLERIEAVGKHLFYFYDNGLVGHVHLGLFGKFRVTPGSDHAPIVGQVRMRMAAEAGTVDLAGPTDCSIGTADERDAIVARLGPDPLRRDAQPEVAIDRMAKSAQPIGQLLLDQRVLAGVGNVYRAEALFVQHINPRRAGKDCTRAELTGLWDTVAAMLRQGVKDNRIITIDRSEFPIPKGPARRGDTTYVYHRDVCLRCSSPVQTVELGGRACYYCPTCQPR